MPDRNASNGVIGAAGAANAGALGGGSARLTGGGTIGFARGTLVSGISTGETPAVPRGIGAGGRGTSTDIARRGAGITVAELVRQRALGRPVVARTDATTIRELRRLGGLLKKVHTDSRGAYSQTTAAALRDLYAAIRALAGTGDEVSP